MSTAVITSSLGGFDKETLNVAQSLDYDFYRFDDSNFPLRSSMTPRLQAKIPKCFGWQLKPDYDYYMWLDGNISLAHPDTLKYFQDACEDIVVMQHPQRNTIWWEYRYNHRGLHSNAPSNYLTERYTGEFLDEQMDLIKNDDYTDDLLVNGGAFMYRNTPKVQEMLKEWWYHISRYMINDQLSFAYVIKKSGIQYKVLPGNIGDCKWLKVERHKVHG